MQQKMRIEYPPRSAGRRLTEAVPTIGITAMVADVERLLISKHQSFESINYVYVVDYEGKLVGVFSIKTLFRVPKITKVKDVMVVDPIVARAYTDREHVAFLAVRHNLKAIPIIDNEGYFLGAITSDMILSIINEEAAEDLLIRAGVRHYARDILTAMNIAPFIHLRRRLPWLIVGLFGGVLAATVVGKFEGLIAEEVLLAAFIPTILYMTDAVGTQSQTIFIRSLVLQDQHTISSYLLKELKVSAMIGVILSGLIFFVGWLGFGSLVMGIVTSTALFTAILVSGLVAVILPWVFARLKRDPALASGPFSSILSNLMTLGIYFGTAYLVLGVMS